MEAEEESKKMRDLARNHRVPHKHARGHKRLEASFTIAIITLFISPIVFQANSELVHDNAFGSRRLSESATNATSVTRSSSSADPLTVSESASRATGQLGRRAQGEEDLLSSDTGPPVYRSAPKHIGSADLLTNGRKELRQAESPEPLISSNSFRASGGGGPSLSDLHSAAGHHKKKKKKIIVVHKKKKKKKKRKVKVIVVHKKKKKKAKKKKKIIVVHKKKKPLYLVKKHSMKYPSKKMQHSAPVQRHHWQEEAEHHEEPKLELHTYGHQSHSHAAPSKGKFYEYRAVPKPKEWKFGFKRGNDMHKIERHEHGHKSHFKTLFTWKDKKGQGKHLFDYNHGDKHKKHQAAAAATSLEPQKQPAIQVHGSSAESARPAKRQQVDGRRGMRALERQQV